MRLITLGALLIIVSGPAAAQASAVDPAGARAAGDWRLSEVGGRIACKLKLTLQTNFAGYEMKAPLACRLAFPALQSVAGWTLGAKGGIVFADFHAQPLVTFPALSAGPVEARAPDGHTWRLELLKAAGEAGAPPAAPAQPPAPAPPAPPVTTTPTTAGTH